MAALIYLGDHNETENKVRLGLQGSLDRKKTLQNSITLKVRVIQPTGILSFCSTSKQMIDICSSWDHMCEEAGV